MTINTNNDFINTCFRLIDALGSPSVQKAVNMANLATGIITNEDVARTAIVLRSLEMEGADRAYANEWFNAIITKADQGTEELVKSFM